MTAMATMLEEATDVGTFGLLDEVSKREIRRAILTAVAVPGYQVPFGSREMPVSRGWRSGGLQVTLGLVAPDDRVKVIDQGDDAGVNAVNLRRLIVGHSGCAEESDSREATIVQSRHRIPEDPMRDDQVLVLQVPVPEPLRGVERDMREQQRMHAEADYSRMWVALDPRPARRVPAGRVGDLARLRRHRDAHQQVAVMQHGRIVETGLTDQVFEDPQHPYSQRLVAAARG